MSASCRHRPVTAVVRLIALAVAALLLGALTLLPSPAHAQGGKRVLIYSGTTGFRHTEAINNGVPIVKAAIEDAGYTADVEDCSGSECATANENPRVFTDENLAKYDAILLFNVSSAVSGADVLWNQAQRDAIVRFVQNGGGIAGNHNATDMGAGQQTWNWWDGAPDSAVGTLMKGHAATDINNKATVQVADRNNLATRDLPDTYQFGDEHYNFTRSVRGSHHVLATLDERSYTPGGNAMGADHPITWCKLYNGDAVADGTATAKPYQDGRVWVTGMGHFGANYTDRGGNNELVKQIVGGVRWVAGEGKKSDCSGTVWSNFTRTVLVNNVQGPMGLDIAPDGKVYWTEIGPTPGIESEGFLRVYDPAGPPNNKTEVLKILTRADHSNSEDGVLGMTLENGFDLADPSKRDIFIYYSPRGPWPTSGPASITLGYNQVSRFTLTADGKSVEPNSERVILRVPKAKIVGSPSGFPGGPTDSGPGHVGGAGLDFDSEGNLYLGVGDDVSPNAPGHAASVPLDYRAKERWDARKTSANSADLRGKVLRIKPLDDIAAGTAPGVGATYAIPPGNMFAPSTPQTRPEIYAMGFRQPFTVQADSKYPGRVAVGEYCADNGSDIAGRAPAGTCEWDLVDKPSFRGWPFCTGDNSAALSAFRWNYAANATTNQRYDCSLSNLPSDIRYAPDGQTPVEPSFNGLDTLPGPAEPATIWKKYGGAKGTVNGTDPGNIDPGGMSPVTGPIYRYNAATAKPGAFPPYYDGSWFITNRGDANGGWWKEARLRKDDGKLLRVNDWAPINPTSQATATTVIPSRFGPDGALYMARWNSGCCRDGNSGASTELIKIEFNVQDECLEDSSAPNTSALVAGRRHPSEPDTYLTDATLSVNASDVGCAGVAKTEYRVNSSAEGDWTEYTSPKKFETPGTYVVDYRATDAKGNASAPKQITFKVVEVNDHDAPTVTATVTGTKTGEQYTAPATLKLVATDPLSSISSIEYKVNQVDDWTKVDFDGQELSEEVTQKFAEAGFKFVEFRATDESGNTSEIGSVQFSVVGSCAYPRSSEFDGPLDEWWLRHTRNGGTPTTGQFAPTVAGGQLTMPTMDFELDGNNGTTSVGPINFLGRDLPQLGDAWTVETEFVAQFTGGWQSMGLMLWRGDDNFFRSSLTHSLSGNGGQRQLFIEQSKDSPSSNPEGSRTQPGGNVNLPQGYNGPVTMKMRYTRAAGADVVKAEYKIVSPEPASADWVAFGGGANFLDLNPSTGARRDSAGSRVGLYSQGNFPGSAGTFAYAGTPGTMKVNYFRVTPDVAQPTCPDDDVTPPGTTAALDPAEPGAGGTYTGPVGVKFTATDAKSVDYTQVKIDDGPWQKNENDADTSPFASTSTVSALGTHVVRYRSADKAGNLEPAKEIAFTISKRPASQVRDFFAAGTQWDPTEAEVNFGEAVTWNFPKSEVSAHNVKLIAPDQDQQTGGAFLTDIAVSPGGPPASYTFRKAGGWTFICTLHATWDPNAKKWSGMTGTVKVGEDPNPGGGDGGGQNPPPVITPPSPSGNTPPIPEPTATAAKLGKLPKTSLSSLIKKGVKVSSACQSGLTGKVTLALSKQQARKVGSKKALTLASKSVTCSSSGKASVTLKVSKKAKKALKKALRKRRALSASLRIQMGTGSAATSDSKTLKLTAGK